MGESTGICGALAAPERELLERIQRGMAITADLSRADLLLACPRNMDEVVAIAQAQPHSIASIYETSLVNKTLTRVDAPVILSAWHRRRHMRSQRDLIPTGTPIIQDVYPIRGRDGEVVALFSLETSLIQLERHRQRHISFRRAIEWLQWMCMRGELASAAELSPFGEWDGVVFVDAQRRITYLSGIANNLYRKLGYMGDLRGKRLSSLGTRDDEMVVAALRARRPLERQVEENQHIWIRKVVPIWPPATVPGRLQRLFSTQTRAGDVAGAIILVHDDTEEQRKQQELDVKVTMIQEVHHRVKNNLQTIAALLRMQARRAESEATRHELQEAIARILSVAVIHEFLSLKETQSINIRDVGQRIISQVRQIVTPGKQVNLSVDGPAIYLASQQATACVWRSATTANRCLTISASTSRRVWACKSCARSSKVTYTGACGWKTETARSSRPSNSRDRPRRSIPPIRRIVRVHFESVGVVFGLLASSLIARGAYCVLRNGLRTTYNEEDAPNSSGMHPNRNREEDLWTGLV